MMVLVTKQSLSTLISNSNDAKKARIVGRALFVLFQRQTQEEQLNKATVAHNGVGFASCDARLGCLAAEYFTRYHSLPKWQMSLWLKIGSKGFPKICKYDKQLNEIAEIKATREKACQ